MKKLVLFFVLITLSSIASAVCTSPISRTNNSSNTVLTASKLNLDFNTLYTRANELPGDCITDETITSAKIANGTIVNADISASAAIDISKTNYSVAIIKQVYPAASGVSINSTANTWIERTLNTESDPDGIVTLSSNKFSLSPGTYLIDGNSPVYGGPIQFSSRVYSVTNSIERILGSHAISDSGTMAHSYFYGIITVSSTEQFSIQSYSGQTITNAYGVPLFFDTNAVDGVATQVKITRIK